MQSIMLATDGSDQAGEALDFAIELARDTGATIEIVVVHPPRMPGRGGALPILEIEQPGGAGRIAARAAETVEQAGLKASAHSLSGDPAGEICAVAAAMSPDIVVLGSRGLGAVGSALMGSVSRAVVKKCTRPVTVVKSSGAVREPTSA